MQMSAQGFASDGLSPGGSAPGLDNPDIAFVDGGGVRWVGPAAGLHDAADDAVRGFARGTA